MIDDFGRTRPPDGAFPVMVTYLLPAADDDTEPRFISVVNRRRGVSLGRDLTAYLRDLVPAFESGLDAELDAFINITLSREET